MQFQIRYEVNAEYHMDEIEANSPEEAVVKFEQLRRTRPVQSPGDLRVTSVSAADIGEAFAADECLPLADDAVTNDAPADLRFDAGETLVTWTADDGRGNIATGVQRVIVNAGGGPTSIFDAIRDIGFDGWLVVDDESDQMTLEDALPHAMKFMRRYV